MLGPVAVLLPVKAFSEAKARLAPALDPPARAELARALASGVLASASPLPVAVVCDDADVAAWARGAGALVIWEPERGLNRAVEAGVERLSGHGVDKVIVVHSDLSRPRHPGWMALSAGVTLVPDRAGNGTNAICVPATARFTFSYGPGSCARHADEARRLGLPLRVVPDASLGRDVDVPADLADVVGLR